jgi:pyruvate-formate lyase
LNYSFDWRLEKLRETKQEQARRKIELLGPRDADEQGNVPLALEDAVIVDAISGSGVPVKEMLLKGYKPKSNHPSGGFFGAGIVGENFLRLLEVHPTYVDPLSSMAGVYMVSFNSYRKPDWNPDYDYSHLQMDQERLGIDHGIGGLQHFCPDLRIGLDLGWGGLLEKIRKYRLINTDTEFYDGLESIVLGMQDWICRHGVAAAKMAHDEPHPEVKENLLTISRICFKLVDEPPCTFREACQWLVFFQAAAKMYNGSGEWGQLDELLRPYYERDVEEGIFTDDEAEFHIACLLLSETAYIQLGGPDRDGKDLTSPVSYRVLEAVHRLKTPANIGVRVGSNIDPGLMRKGVEILLMDKMGFPKFLGDEQLVEGWMKNGYSVEDARTRIYAGCHWLAMPGREYSLMDIIKIDFAKVFDTSFKEMMGDDSIENTADNLWKTFRANLARAVEVVALGIDFHIKHMYKVFPELYLDLFCYGPLEKGLDASNGGLEFYSVGVDGASLANVADSFAAIEQRIENEEKLNWDKLQQLLDSNWSSKGGERYRLMMRNIPRFGSGGSRADTWAKKITMEFTNLVKEKYTPDGFQMVPGLFSWAKVVSYGQRLGATPDGRRAGEPLSHGPNPSPGFNRGKGGTPTQMVSAVALVQPGYGNTAPLQIDIDPSMGEADESVLKVEALIKSHFDMGGTMVNINVLNKEQLIEANRHPEEHPDLIVRVTGFSAYFASLSPELRQYVVDRVISGE